MQFTIQNTGKTSVKNKYVVYCVYISDFLECNKSEHEKLLGLIRLKAIGIACVMLIVFMSSCCCYLITEITLQQNILEQISNINQNFWEVAQFTYFQHTHTHTHTLFLWFTGTLHRRNGFYTVQTVCAITLHLPST